MQSTLARVRQMKADMGWAMIRLFRCKLGLPVPLLACPGISRPHPIVRRPLVDVPFPPQTPVCSGHRGTGRNAHPSCLVDASKVNNLLDGGYRLRQPLTTALKEIA